MTTGEVLYRAHGAQVLAWCIRLGGPGVDPEDAAQQVFEIALRRVEDFRGDSAPSTWLFGITRRVLANLRRRAILRRWLHLDGEPDQDGVALAGPDATDEALDHARRRRAVVLALETLSSTHREVLVLADIEERPAAEVAQMLGIPVGTVYSRQHAARRQFARVWAVRFPGQVAPDNPTRSEEAEVPAPDNVIPLRRGR